jgi:hypothetical protein
VKNSPHDLSCQFFFLFLGVVFFKTWSKPGNESGSWYFFDPDRYFFPYCGIAFKLSLNFYFFFFEIGRYYQVIPLEFTRRGRELYFFGCKGLPLAIGQFTIYT